MINLCSAKYGDFFGVHDCDCGKKHEFPVRCKLERGAYNFFSAFLSQFTPFLSRVVILYDDDTGMERVLGHIKRDYRVVPVKIDDDKRSLDRLSLPEDTKLIIAVGREAVEGAKYKAADLPVVVAAPPTVTALSPVCIVKEDGLYVAYDVKAPVGYIFDPDCEYDKAEVFGMISARLITSFEYYASSLFSGGDYCPFLAGMMSDISSKAILYAAENDKNSPRLKETLLVSALKLSLISSVLPVGSGEVQCALTFKLLGSELKPSELQFVFAAVLNSLYLSHVSYRPCFVPPPDNNYRLEQISEMLGISESRAITKLRKQIGGFEAEMTDYKLKEYSVDLSRRLEKNGNLFRLAFRIFKRLRPDDGFSLKELKSNDISLCLALAPDVIGGESMLTSLKRLGELDRYIV